MIPHNLHRPCQRIERKVWELDQRVNQRGVMIDSAFLNRALELIASEQERLIDEAYELTGGVNVSQRQAILDWCAEQGYPLPGYTKNDIAAALDDPDCPGPVRKVLRVRQQQGKTSTAKYTKMAECLNTDNRVRGHLRFHGASTGRWSGMLLQTQNFPRPHWAIEGFEETVIDLLMSDDPHLVEPLFGVDLMEALSSTLRSAIVAPEGKLLAVGDYSQIEARVVAWLAGQQDVLDVFASGADIYKHSAAPIYGTTYDQVDKQQRQIGKVATLALGFQGGVGAFQNMASVYGVEVDDTQAKSIVTAWRAANPHIVGLWKGAEQAAYRAIRNPGQGYIVAGKIGFIVKHGFLFMQLPSGRRISYPNARILTKYDARRDWSREVICYDGVDRYTRKWGECQTYGGDLVQSATQGAARDVMAEAMLRVEAEGYEVTMTVHDELVCERDAVSCDLSQFLGIMRTPPQWADGLPIEADGYIGARYRK